MYEGRLDVPTVEVLRHKGKRKKPQETRGRFNVGTSITKRPKEVRKRETFGHWELDSVVSGRGKEFSCYPAIEEDLKIKVTLILLGKEAVMKTQMVYFESFSQKKPMSLSLQRVNFQRRLL
jgi:IS30 family transposase